MRTKTIIRSLTKGMAVVGCCLLGNVFTACTDTWDDHYDDQPAGLSSSSLWEAISANPELSNFKTVLQAVGYDKQLASSQKFTVFAPTNASLSEAEAESLIAKYKSEKGIVNDEDNEMLKEFVRNHIALYNYSVSSASDDSIKLMNGKFGVLKPNSFAGVDMLTKNENYQNGVLYTMSGQIGYKPNIFEAIHKDADLTQLNDFLYNPKFYYKVFDPSQSVEGGLDEQGRTVFLDSVFYQRNELFGYTDYINNEDSMFWMVVPTNPVWDQLLTEYTEYFKYPNSKVKDSLEYVMPRLAIVQGSVFNNTFNSGVFNKQKVSEEGAGGVLVEDSAMSVNCIRDFTLRKIQWSGQPFNYYEYYNAWQPGGVFQQTNTIDCSNGLLRKSDAQWPIDKLQTFHRYVVVEAEDNIWEMSKNVNSAGDSINTISPIQRSVTKDTLEEYNFYGKVWGNSFVEFEPVQNAQNHTLTLRIDNVLSNVGYDIYLVTAPAIAYDRNAPEAQRVPTKMRFALNYMTLDGKMVEQRLRNYEVVTTKADSMHYIKLAEDFKFPASNYGLKLFDETPTVTLKIETRVSNSELNKFQFTRNMRIDCVLLVPHGTMTEGLVPADAKVPVSDQGKPAMLMTPHGDTPQANTFYMLR